MLKWGLCRKTNLGLFSTWYYSCSKSISLLFCTGLISRYFILDFYTHIHFALVYLHIFSDCFETGKFKFRFFSKRSGSMEPVTKIPHYYSCCFVYQDCMWVSLHKKRVYVCITSSFLFGVDLCILGDITKRFNIPKKRVSILSGFWNYFVF